MYETAYRQRCHFSFCCIYSIDLCRFCVLSLHMEAAVLDQTHTVKIAVHSAAGCCTATTMALISTKHMYIACSNPHCSTTMLYDIV